MAGRYYWYHKFDSYNSTKKIVKLKSSIEKVLNQKSVNPKNLAKITGQLSSMHPALVPIV